MSRGPEALLLAALLAACATSPPGEDDKGRKLVAEATPVLHALVAYRKDNGGYPLSLHELVPRYLEVVPFDPGLLLERDAGRVQFMYSRAFPYDDNVVCSAPLGDLHWTCADR